MPKPYVITIVGSESSGKTTLARQLSQTLGCLWVPEYARAFLTELDRPYQKEDLATIAKGQMALISSELEAHGPECTPAQFNMGASLILDGSVDEQSENAFLSFQLTGFGEAPRKVLIVDSGLLSIRMWAAIKYSATVPLVEQALEDDITDMYLLCRPLLQWEPDQLREAPGLLDRSWIYNQFLQELFIMQKRSISVLS